MNCPRCGTSNLDNLSACVRCGAALVPAGEAATFIGVSLPPTPAAKAGAAAAPAPAPPVPPRQGDGSNVATAGPWAALGISSSSDHVDFGPRYRIDRMLGQGGMGAVYKAWDKELERPVALKLIRPELAVDPAVEQRFKQELLLASKISHKNILRIHDLGEAAGVKFISMAFVEGQDLHQLLTAEGKLTLERTLKIARQLCGALEAAHSEGVVHRDFKPQNILLDKQENVYVSDFGLAKSLEHDSGMTKSGEFLGTPRYMAPEQVQGGKIDHRADLYALGLILYEMVTGDVPFHADTTLQLMYKRVHEVPKSPQTLDPGLPDWITGIIMKCLERNPDQRYQNAAEILHDINAGVAPPTVAKPPESRQFTFALPVMSRARWAGVIAAILVVAVAIGALVLRGRFKAAGPGSGKPVTVLVADFSNHTGDPVFDGTLEPMFNVALEGASFINAYSRGTARKLAQKLPHPTDRLDEQSARLIAISQGLGAIVTGSLSRRGDEYKVSVEAMDAVSGNTIASAEATAANKDAVLTVVPKLAAPIRKALGDTTPESEQLNKAAGTFTAASLEVVHQYSIALDEQFAGKVEEALKSFAKAAELDPNFARAYSGMSAMARNLGKQQDGEKYIKLAMEHEDRLTDRERIRVRGVYYMGTGNWQKCVEEYSELVKLYPADNIGYTNLSACYTALRNIPKAVEAARRAVEIVPQGALQHLVLSFYSSYGGDFQGGEREARAALDRNPSYGAYLALAEAQVGQGQLSQAETYHKLETVSALGASIAASGLADLASYEGRFETAVRLLEHGAAADLAAKRPENAADKFAALANTQLLRGQKGAAVAAADKALANSQSVQVRFLAAQTFLEAGETAKAQKLAAGLGSELQAEPQAYAKIIAGKSALKRGDARQAIKDLTEANNLLDTWIGRFELGRVYLEAGQFVEADSEFDRCIKRRGEALELFMDNVATYAYFPPVYYYQGRVREGLKSPGFAESYRTYLSIRGQTGEDPLVPAVRRRLGQ